MRLTSRIKLEAKVFSSHLFKRNHYLH